MRRLHVSPELSLPLDAVTQRISFLGRTGSGKTYAAGVTVEEILKLKQQVVILDPKGDWFGLRSTATGKGSGFAITILGGEHGDVPLEPTAGALVADMVVDTGVSFILDLSLFDSKADENRFATDFADRLYRRKARKKTAMMLVIDEADQFFPQVPMPEERKMLSRFDTIARRGRGRGIGLIICSQRSAAVHKGVLSQTEVMVAHQTTDPRDKKAILNWVEDKVDDKQKIKEFLKLLIKLKKQGIWWSPSWLDIFKIVRVRQKITFDSSATPRVGQRRREPKMLAPIDLERLKSHMAETIERAKAADPKLAQVEIARLRGEVVRLQKELDKKPIQVTAGAVVTKTEHKVVEVNVVKKMAIRRIEALVSRMEKVQERLKHWDVAIGVEGSRLASALASAEAKEGVSRDTAVLIERAKQVERERISTPVRKKPAMMVEAELSPIPYINSRLGKGVAPFKLADDGGPSLVAGERKILETAAAAHPMKRTMAELATLSGFSIRSSTFKQYWRSLRRRGYLIEHSDGVSVTPEGLARVGGVVPETKTHEEIVQMWRARLVRGEVAILDYAIRNYPNWISMEDLSREINLSLSSSSTKQYLRSLRRNGIIAIINDSIRATDLLFPKGKP